MVGGADHDYFRRLRGQVSPADAHDSSSKHTHGWRGQIVLPSRGDDEDTFDNLHRQKTSLMIIAALDQMDWYARESYTSAARHGDELYEMKKSDCIAA